MPTYDNSGGSWWEWLPEGSISREIVRIECVPPDASNYGDVFEQELAPPTEMVSLKGHGLSQSEANDIITAVRTRATTATIVDKVGQTHTGRILSATYPVIDGLELYTVTIQMRKA